MAEVWLDRIEDHMTPSRNEAGSRQSRQRPGRDRGDQARGIIYADDMNAHSEYLLGQNYHEG